MTTEEAEIEQAARVIAGLPEQDLGAPPQTNAQLARSVFMGGVRTPAMTTEEAEIEQAARIIAGLPEQDVGVTS